MAAQNKRYNIQVGVIGSKELTKFQTSIDKMNKAATKSQKTLGRMNTSLKGVKNSVTGSVQAFKALAIAMVSREIVNTLTSFEDLRVTLETIEGSTAGAEAAFNNLNSLVQKTPFQIEALTESYIKLKAAGLDPTNKQMMLFSDVASITTDKVGTLAAITDLFARNTAGGLGLEDLNRLADRGVPVFDIFQKKLGLTRLEVSAFGKSAEGSAKLLEVLSDELDVRFGGSSDKALNNLSTSMSNFQGQIKVTIDEISQAFGGTGGLSEMFQTLTAGVDKFGKGFTSFAADIGPVVTQFKELVENSTALKVALAAVAIAIIAATAPVSGIVIAVGLLIANWDLVKEKTLSVIQTFKDFGTKIAAMPAEFLQHGKDIVNGFVNGIKDYMSAKKEALLKPFSTFATSVKGFFGIQSPSRMFIEIGGFMAEGLSIGIENGINKPIQIMSDAAKNMQQSVLSAVENGLTGFFDSIIDGTKNGKEAFKDMTKNILNDIAKMIIQIKIIKPLMDSIGGALGGGSVSGSARGNVFPNGIGNSGPLTTYASGGIISGRTLVGSSLMGEAGGGRSEAVVPLRRIGGKLGVSASPVNVNVINNAGAEVQVSESTGNDGSKSIDIMIDTKVRNAFSSGRMDKTMKANYGVKRIGE